MIRTYFYFSWRNSSRRCNQASKITLKGSRAYFLCKHNWENLPVTY